MSDIFRGLSRFIGEPDRTTIQDLLATRVTTNQLDGATEVLQEQLNSFQGEVSELQDDINSIPEFVYPLTGVYFNTDPRGNIVQAAYSGARAYGTRVTIPVSGHITTLAFLLFSSSTGENFDLGVLDTSSTTRNRLDYGPGGTSSSPNYAGAALAASVVNPTWVGCGAGLQYAAPNIPVTAGQQVDLFLGLDNSVQQVGRAASINMPTLPPGLMVAPGGAAAKITWIYTAHYFIGAATAETLLSGGTVIPLIIYGIS